MAAHEWWNLLPFICNVDPRLPLKYIKNKIKTDKYLCIHKRLPPPYNTKLLIMDATPENHQEGMNEQNLLVIINKMVSIYKLNLLFTL